MKVQKGSYKIITPLIRNDCHPITPFKLNPKKVLVSSNKKGHFVQFLICIIIINYSKRTVNNLTKTRIRSYEQNATWADGSLIISHMQVGSLDNTIMSLHVVLSL